MKITPPFKINKAILVVVLCTALFFIAAGVGLGVWHAGEMRQIVSDQFNSEQLVIAHNIRRFIERELGLLKKELGLLADALPPDVFQPEKAAESIWQSFGRVQESGVWRIMMVDRGREAFYAFMPYRHWTAGTIGAEERAMLPISKGPGSKKVRISRPEVKAPGIMLTLTCPAPSDPDKFMVFDVNLSWLLTPFMKNIRSGTSGYAWLIDSAGMFLFHPMADFIGKNAFTIREARDPQQSFAQINFIQKEQMLQGKEGTGFYFSAWHRGITGRIKKLIAYCPVTISTAPPQTWSIAVVAPNTEIEDSIHRGYLEQLLLQALIVLVIVVGAATVLFFEIRWSRLLENRVSERTVELKRSEEKYRSLVESAEDFIFTIDINGNFQSMNSFTASFFGGRPEAFIGREISCLFPPKTAEKQMGLVKLVFRYGKSVRDEFDMKTGENRIWISANFMPLKSSEGQVSAVLCIARDITENKNLEHQLINAEKLASIGTLAAGVAHEINNPLGVILGFTDLLLQKSEKDSQTHEDLKTIERQGYHCKEIVENLLSFARSGTGRTDYAELNQSLGEIIKVVRHTLEMKDIMLQTDFAADIPPVRGDSRQLQQVFLNLINNAAAAMPAGGSLTILTRRGRSPHKAVAQFQDTGVGIEPENLDHIFEPFFTTKPEGEGTGLGLFVSYGIITRFGGSIDCDSHPKRHPEESGGTTFTVKLLTQQQEGE